MIRRQSPVAVVPMLESGSESCENESKSTRESNRPQLTIMCDHSVEYPGAAEVLSVASMAQRQALRDVKTMHAISKVYDFLCGDAWKKRDPISRDQALIDLENLVKELLEEIPKDTLVRAVLESNGWTGSRFAFSPSFAVDGDLLKQQIGSLYFANRAAWSSSRTLSASTPHRHRSLKTPAVPDKMGSPPIAEGIADRSVAEAAAAAAEEDTDNAALLLMWSYCPDLVFVDSSIAASGFNGVCMLADISGFTKLSSECCLNGSEGLDRLHAVTDGFFGTLVVEIYRCGGDGEACYRHDKYVQFVISLIFLCSNFVRWRCADMRVQSD